jgi:hypothetical protein
MNRWFVRHWRDLALIALLMALGLAWRDQMTMAWMGGATARCALLPW